MIEYDPFIEPVENRQAVDYILTKLLDPSNELTLQEITRELAKSDFVRGLNSPNTVACLAAKRAVDMFDELKFMEAVL